MTGNTATLTPLTNGTTYTWSPIDGLSCVNCLNPFAHATENTVYCLTVSNTAGCSTSSCTTVNGRCPDANLLSIPNAFTPNGDGINDDFCLQGWEYCNTAFHVMIYDQWGRLVFESFDPAFCWDGGYQGKILDPAVFVYSIKARFASVDYSRKGNITLLK